MVVRREAGVPGRQTRLCSPLTSSTVQPPRPQTCRSWAAERGVEAEKKLAANEAATQVMVGEALQQMGGKVDQKITLLRGEAAQANAQLAGKVEAGFGALKKLEMGTRGAFESSKTQAKKLETKVDSIGAHAQQMQSKVDGIGAHLVQVERGARMFIGELQSKVQQVEQGFGTLQKELVGIAKGVSAVTTKPQPVKPPATVTPGPGTPALLEGEEDEKEEEGQEVDGEDEGEASFLEVEAGEEAGEEADEEEEEEEEAGEEAGEKEGDTLFGLGAKPSREKINKKARKAAERKIKKAATQMEQISNKNELRMSKRIGIVEKKVNLLRHRKDHELHNRVHILEDKVHKKLTKLHKKVGLRGGKNRGAELEKRVATLEKKLSELEKTAIDEAKKLKETKKVGVLGGDER